MLMGSVNIFSFLYKGGVAVLKVFSSDCDAVITWQFLLILPPCSVLSYEQL